MKRTHTPSLVLRKLRETQFQDIHDEFYEPVKLYAENMRARLKTAKNKSEGKKAGQEPKRNEQNEG